MNRYEREFYIEERVRDLLREAENARLLRDSAPMGQPVLSGMRSGMAAAVWSLASAVRRFVQLAWAW